MQDPMFILANLTAALDHPALGDDTDTPAKCAASWEAAVALGKARLFGFPLGELEGVLPYPFAVAATVYLSEQLPRWNEQTETLDTTWDETTHPDEAEHLLTSTLQDRFDTWAACVAISEVREPGGMMDEIELRLDSWDDALQTQSELIATLSETSLVVAWRDSLVEPYRTDAPWWLTGELDRIAQRSMNSALATMPNSEFWGVVQRRAMLPDILSIPILDASIELPQAIVRTMKWVHPNRSWRARLDYPDPSNEVEENRPRRLHFHVITEHPTSLLGTAIRLGDNESVVGGGPWATVTLRQLRADPLLRLFVADEEWELVLKKDSP